MGKQIIVVAAIVRYGDEILVVQRSTHHTDLQAGKWEFPGGKVEFGEDPKVALVREIHEELSLDIVVQDEYCISSAIFNNAQPAIHAVMITYLTRSPTKIISLNSGHQFKWVRPQRVMEFDFALLDIPVIQKMNENGFELPKD